MSLPTPLSSRTGLAHNGLMRRCALVFVALMLAGCASTGVPDASAPDPLEPINRVTSTMNKVLQDVVLTPVSKAYVTVAPSFVQTGVHHFFSNLGEPVVIVNDLLQGKVSQFGSDLGRFVTNSTLGLAGLFDVATPLGMEAHDEDFGQTLAVWGVPSGPYIVLPMLGPSTLRDAGSSYVDARANPLRVYDLDNIRLRNGVLALQVLDAGSQLLMLQDQLESAIDRYSFIRSAWLQHRKFEIYDGNPPAPAYPDLPPLPDDE